MHCLGKMVSHRFKCPETHRGKTPLLQHYRGVRRGRQCRVVCCIKGCNTLHKHTHQSVEDSAHTNTLHRPHMEVGASTCPRDKLHSLSRDQWFQLVLSLLPYTIHTAPLTPCHPHTHTSLPHYTLILTTISTKALSKMAPVAPRKPRMITPNPPVIISMLPTRNCLLEMAPAVTRKPRMTDLPSLMPYKGMSLTLWGDLKLPLTGSLISRLTKVIVLSQTIRDCISNKCT